MTKPCLAGKEQFFSDAVLKFNMSNKAAKDLYEYSIAVWIATKFGSGLTWPEIEKAIKDSTP